MLAPFEHGFEPGAAARQAELELTDLQGLEPGQALQGSLEATARDETTRVLELRAAESQRDEENLRALRQEVERRGTKSIPAVAQRWLTGDDER